MLTANQKNEVRARINRIIQLAQEIEAVPNFGPDLWTMRKVDEKCRVIQGDCQGLGILIGSGDAPSNTNVSPGMTVITANLAVPIGRHIARIRDLAVAIEQVPNFGPDIWTMRKIDDECRQIVWHAQQAWALIAGSGTG